MKWFKGINQEADSEQDDRVAVSLARLRALEFTARGFSFLPRQPVNSILSGRHRAIVPLQLNLHQPAVKTYPVM